MIKLGKKKKIKLIFFKKIVKNAKSLIVLMIALNAIQIITVKKNLTETIMANVHVRMDIMMISRIVNAKNALIFGKFFYFVFIIYLLV